MMRLTLMIACAAFATLAFAAVPRAQGLKSGRQLMGVWKITVTPTDDDAGKAGARKFDETLTLGGDKLSTATLAARGFGPAEYQEDVRAAGPAQFTCTQTSDAEGAAVWGGFTTGQDIQGTLVWTKKDGTVVHYAFQGTKG